MNNTDNLGDFTKEQPYQILSMTPDLAYLIGVYMGDAYCYRSSRTYKTVLCVVDRDFAEEFAQTSERLGIHPNIWEGQLPSWKQYQRIVQVTLCNKSLFMTLTRLTNNKKRIPKAIQESGLPIKLRFLEGLFDSDAMVKDPNLGGDLRIWIRLVGGRKVRTLMRFVQACGMRVGSWGRRDLPSGKAYHGFHVSVSDFVRLGGKFHIARKQQRLIPVLTD